MYEKLFSPITIKGMELKNRVILPAMGTRMSDHKMCIRDSIARVKGESDVFANSPVLRQYLEENDESLRPALMSDIEQLLKNDDCKKSIVVVSKDGRILSNEENLDMSVSEDMMKDVYKRQGPRCITTIRRLTPEPAVLASPLRTNRAGPVKKRVWRWKS